MLKNGFAALLQQAGFKDPRTLDDLVLELTFFQQVLSRTTRNKKQQVERKIERLEQKIETRKRFMHIWAQACLKRFENCSCCEHLLHDHTTDKNVCKLSQHQVLPTINEQKDQECPFFSLSLKHLNELMMRN